MTGHRGRFFLYIGLVLAPCWVAGCGPTSPATTLPPAKVETPTPQETAQTQEANAAPSAASHTGNHRAGKPVAVTLSLDAASARAGEEREVTVRMKIAPMWEIRPLDATPSFLATSLQLDLPAEIAAVGAWQAPVPVSSAARDGHAVYQDEAVFVHRLKVTEKATAGQVRITCRIGYQACNEQMCLRPAEEELAVPLRLE